MNQIHEYAARIDYDLWMDMTKVKSLDAGTTSINAMVNEGLRGLSNLTSGLLDLCRSVILAFPFNIRFFSTGPLVVDFDEHGANQAFE